MRVEEVMGEMRLLGAGCAGVTADEGKVPVGAAVVVVGVGMTGAGDGIATAERGAVPEKLPCKGMDMVTTG
jgi:hypothetical protein